MAERMTGAELVALIQRVFIPRSTDTGIGIMVDLPDAKVADDGAWASRREIALDWVRELRAHKAELGLDTHLIAYGNVHTNNGDLPPKAWVLEGDTLPAHVDDLDSVAAIPMAEVYAGHSILLAVTKFSSTAPLKVAARTHPFRAATMPGFGEAMIPALRLDYTEINRRVGFLKGLMDQAKSAEVVFDHPSGEDRLFLDLRWRPGHASGGLLPDLGVAGNLPSGEAYMVPYEGEREGEPSLTSGIMPVEFRGEVVRYRIEQNRAVEVLSEGPESTREAELLTREPAYGNLAELGLGVLAAFGVKPIGVVLLDEKLGLHLAFGRSEHFGGQVGPDAFSSPEAVVHIDRVYVPETQPLVKVRSLDFTLEDGRPFPLMRDGDYVTTFA